MNHRRAMLPLASAVLLLPLAYGGEGRNFPDGRLRLNLEAAKPEGGAAPVQGSICRKTHGARAARRNPRVGAALTSYRSPENVPGDGEHFTSLFDGRTFDGWKYPEALKGRWDVGDGVIRLRADQPPRRPGRDDLWTEKSYEDFVLVVEWRLLAEPVRKPMNAFTEDGLIQRDERGRRMTHEILHAGDSGIFLRGDRKAQVNIWSQPMGSGDINPYHKDAELPVEVRQACMPKERADRPAGQWNRFVITMRGDRVTVELNDQTVIDGARLPGVAQKGPIGLQNHGDPIEFRNLSIRQLP